MKRSLQLLTLCAASAFSCAPAFAAGPVAPTVPEGSFHCFRGMPASEINYIKAPEARQHRAGVKLGNSKWDNTDGHDLREVNTEGNLRVLVIIVEFEDTKFSRREDPRELVDNMLNGEDFTYQNATGSARAFYNAVSNGQFNPQFDVVGPIQLSKKSVEYVTPSDPEFFTDASGKETQCYPASLAVKEAVLAIDDDIDFSVYDSNNDGAVDFVYMFYAGKGATTGGNKDTTIWPHAFTLEAGLGAPLELDGVAVNRYACSSELGLNNKLSGIGTFCHEFGHVLGLPDLYDTAHNGSLDAAFSPGTFSCMDGGNYNNDEHTPPFFSAYEQYALEWMLPTTVTGGGRFTLLPMGARKFAYKFNTSSDQEYFLVEARDKFSYDYYLEGHGLLAWHIDFDANIWDKNTPNNNDAHQRIDLVEADSDRSTNTRSGDTFPGTNGICEFLENVSPSFIDWKNKSTGYNLREITRNFDGSVSFLCEAKSGAEMQGTALDAPLPEIFDVTDNSFIVDFPAVSGADEYFISVFPMKEFYAGSCITEYVDGFYYAPASVGADGHVSLLVEGLEPGIEYGVMAYAANATNASRSAAPVVAAPVVADFSKAVTNVYATAIPGENYDILLAWDAVTDADDYKISIEQSVPSAILINTPAESLSFDFEGNKLPDGWSGNGKFDSRPKYCGNAVPSYRLETPGAALTSATFEKPICSVAFWLRRHFDEDLCNLQVFGIDKDGRSVLVETISDISKDGSMHQVVFPTEFYAVRFVWNFSSTGLDCNIDDIQIAFTNDFQHSPVTFVFSKVSDTAAVVSGLKSGETYNAYVTPMNGYRRGLRSRAVRFTVGSLPVSAVESVSDAADAVVTVSNGIISVGNDTEFSLYSIDGICIASGITGGFPLPARGLYIVRTPGSSLKINW